MIHLSISAVRSARNLRRNRLAPPYCKGMINVTNTTRLLGKTKLKWRHPQAALSPAFIRSAPPGRHADGNGSYLFVQPSGTRSWIQRLLVRGRRREFGLGSVALVPLAKAREKALANRKLAREGGDPQAEATDEGYPHLRRSCLAWAGTEAGWRAQPETPPRVAVEPEAVGLPAHRAPCRPPRSPAPTCLRSSCPSGTGRRSRPGECACAYVRSHMPLWFSTHEAPAP